jgi:diamine N-acetyltransferase
MVNLKPITVKNFIDAFNLRLATGQEEFVSHPIRSLAQAYVYRDQCQPFGIYAEDRMVGYVLVIYDWDNPEYNIWHMMVDEDEQGKGYGAEALDRILEYVATKPFGKSNRVTLTCNKDNIVAMSLYKSRGFRATENVYDDEIELAMTIG